MSPTRIHGIKLKIERAKRHIADLDGRIRIFCDSEPYALGVQEIPVIEHVALLCHECLPHSWKCNRVGEFTSMLAAKSWIPFARARCGTALLAALRTESTVLLETVDCEVCEWMYVRALRTKAR
jgi:hypothetical protein